MKKLQKLGLVGWLGCAIVVSLAHAADKNDTLLRKDRAELAECSRQTPVELHLKDVISRAMICSPDLVDFRLAHQVAIAETQIAKQRPNPNLSYNLDSINPHPNKSPQGTGKVDSSIRIDQLIELGGKAGYRADAATAAEAASLYQLKYNEKAVLVAIEQLYFDTLSAQQRVHDLGEVVEMNRRVLDVARKRLQVGDVSQLEYKKILLDVTRANNEYQAARSDLSQAKSDLAKALGFDRSIAKSRLSEDWPNHADKLPTVDWDKVERRADLLAYKNRTEAADNLRQLGRSLRIPDLTVGVQYNHAPVTGDVSRGTINTYSFGVSMPLFIRHQFQGEAQKAEVEYYRARDAQLRAEKDAFTSIQNQELDLEVRQERLARVLGDILPSAEEAATMAEFAYSKGAISVLDLIDARRSLRQARTEAAQIRADFAKSLSAFKLAIEAQEN